MKTSYKYGLLLTTIIVCLYSSCIKEIPLEIQNSKEDIVIYSFLNPDSLITVFVGETSHIGSPLNKGLFYKDVFVYDSTIKQSYKLNHTGNGVYSLISLKPKESHIYLISTNAKSGLCTAVDSVYSTTNFTVKDTIRTINQNSSRFFKMNVQFSDPSIHQKHYRVRCLIKQKIYIYDSITLVLKDSSIVSKWSNINSNEIVARNVSSYGLNPKEILFKYPIAPLVNTEFIFGIENYYKKTKKYENLEITIFLDKISPDFFNFIKTESEHIQYLNDPIYTPPTVHTNVLNGLGLVGTYSPTYQNFILK